ncbi:MAG: L-2-amino-thiazoline-4-carboxylic acid hydrolase [Spirochaetota bacterium]
MKTTIQTKLRRPIWNRNQKAARKVLTGRLRSQEESQKGRFIPSDVDRILDQAWRNVDDLMPSMPEQKTLGNFHWVFSGLTLLAIYRSLLNEGTAKDYATNLISDIIWKAYESLRVIRFISNSIIRLITSDLHKQLGIQLRLLLSYPYSPPGYEIDFSSDSDTHYMNIYRCPVLEFYRTQDEEALELFRKTWCVFDYAVAEVMVKGGRYERLHTLSAGDSVCDMRWFVADNKKTGADAGPSKTEK